MMTDPVGDMLTRIRNANMVLKAKVEMPSSRMKEEILRILKREGYISGYEVVTSDGHKSLVVTLRYMDKDRAIGGLKRISKPGIRIYAKKDKIPRVLGGLGTAIISTSRGILTDKEAVQQGLGGEVICYVW